MTDTSLAPSPTHLSELKALARSMLRDDAAVDDVIQQVWIASLDAPRPSLSQDLRWLRGVTRNLAHNFVRDRSRRAAHERTASRDERVDDDPSHHVEREDVRRMLRTAVHELRSPYRETIRARYFEDVTVEQIAARTGRPTNTVKTHLRRALGELKSSLRKCIGSDRARGLALVGAFDWTREDLGVFAPSTLAAGGVTGLWILSRPALAAACFLFVALSTLVWWASQHDRDTPPLAIGVAIQAPSETTTTDLAVAPVAGLAQPSIPAPDRLTVPADTATAEETAATIALAVIDDRRQPVRGATVWHGTFSQSHPLGSTDRHGRLAIHASSLTRTNIEWDAERRDVYRVWATAEHHAKSPLYALNADQHIEGTVTLRVTRGTGRITGTVLDPNGTPVAHAQLQLDRDRRREHHGQGYATSNRPESVTTDAEGTFTFADVVPAIHRCSIQATGLAATRVTFDARPGLCERTVRLDSGARLTGVVLGPDGQRVPAARVRVGWPKRTSLPHVHGAADHDGRFHLDHLPPGRAVLEAVTDAGIARRLLVIGSQAISDLALTLIPRSSATISVVDPDGDPIEGYRVDFVEAPGTWRALNRYTDPGGHVTAPDWPDGPVFVAVRARSDSVPLLTKILQPPHSGVRELVSQRDFESVGFLRGTIARHEARLPTGSSVSLTHHASRSRIATHRWERGDFEFGRLPAGRYDLVAEFAGGARKRLRTLDLDGHDTTLTTPIDLAPLGHLTIEWHWPPNQPVHTRVRQAILSGGRIAGFHSLSESAGPPVLEWDLPEGIYAISVQDRHNTKLLQRMVHLRAGYVQPLPIGLDTFNRATLELELTGAKSETLVVDLHHERLGDSSTGDGPDAGSRVTRFRLVPEWDGRFRTDFAGREDVRQTIVVHDPRGKRSFVLPPHTDGRLWHYEFTLGRD